MKALLINPPRWHELVGKNPSIIEKHRGFNPPLGLLYLAAASKKLVSFTVDILDAQPLLFTYEQLEEWLKERDYDLVGIAAMTFTLVDAHKTALVVKKALPSAKVIFGGTHVHLFPEETVNLEPVDFAIMGEAEYSFSHFMVNWGSAFNPKKIPGLVYKDSLGRIENNSFQPIDQLDTLPFPERQALDFRKYNSILSKGNLCTTIISSRGCPFKCAFCDRPLSPITSHFRYRSAINLVDELCACSELGIHDFLFYDDTFTVNRKRVLEICEEILQRGLDIRWDIRTRVDLIDEEMLKMLKKAGCSAIHYGVEAGNDRVLSTIKKGFTVSQVKDAFQITKKMGIETLAYFMIGLPTEKLRDVQDSFNLVKELKPDYAHFTIFSPYPGTELYHLGLSRGVIKDDIWRDFAKNPRENFKIPVWEENFSRQELYSLIVKFYKSFYLKPDYLISSILRLKSGREFIKKARAGASVLFMRKRNVDKL